MLICLIIIILIKIFHYINRKNNKSFQKYLPKLRFIKKIEKELFRIKERNEVLNLKIKNNNKENLMNLLK